MKQKYTLRKNRFIEWLIDDHEDIQYFGRRFRSDLLSEGKVEVTIEKLFKERDTIPVFLLEEYDDEMEDKHIIDEDVEDEINIKLIKLI